MTEAQEPQVTEDDWRVAHQVWNEALCNSGVPDWNPREFFARALAAERAKARAPFLALLARWDRSVRVGREELRRAAETQP